MAMDYRRLVILLIVLTLVFSSATAAVKPSAKLAPKIKSNEGNEQLYLVMLKDGVSQDVLSRYGEIEYKFNSINAVAIKLTKKAARTLQSHPAVKSIEENQPIYIGPTSSTKERTPTSQAIVPATSGSPDDQWNLLAEGINAKKAWVDFFGWVLPQGEAMPEDQGGDPIKVAIIDSGVDYTISDLDGTKYILEGSIDFCSEDCGRIVDIDDNAMDEYGHGTEMASAILGGGETMFGVAPNAKYYAIKITDENGVGSIVALDAALDWVDANTDADVIYIGVEFYGSSTTTEESINKLYSHGKILVSPSSDPYLFTSMWPTVFGVGAHNKAQVLMPETGDYAEVLGPGEDVPVLTLGGGQTTAQDVVGVAAANVAGAFALLMQWTAENNKGSDYNNDDYWQIMKDTAKSITDGNKADIFAAIASIAPSSPDPNLRLWLDFESVDGSGNPLDKSMYGNVCTSYGYNGHKADQTLDAAVGENAFEFRWFDYLDCGNNASLNITDKISISMWVKSDAWSGSKILMTKGDQSIFGEYAVYYIWYPTQDWVEWSTRGINGNYLGGATWYMHYTPPESLQDNWHHLVVTYDAEGGENNKKIYLDGVLVTQGTGTGYLADKPDEPLWIGRYSHAPHAPDISSYFDGKMDEIRIYSGILTQEDVTELYLGGEPSQSSAPPEIPSIEESEPNPIAMTVIAEPAPQKPVQKPVPQAPVPTPQPAPLTQMNYVTPARPAPAMPPVE